ncbi:MAG TPA: hypothetical protein VFM18_21225, partial [Methanosarcina sp.]|nr:hypothetical protein [Methanosarcina sp.]
IDPEHIKYHHIHTLANRFSKKILILCPNGCVTLGCPLDFGVSLSVVASEVDRYCRSISTNPPTSTR